MGGRPGSDVVGSFFQVRANTAGKQAGEYRGHSYTMDHPHPEIEVGSHYTQTDIEELFDTGFGYRISGINPRRDDGDNRYILLFAAEAGPYDDAVTDGTFTYIGEGLPEKGDQSLSSPGNSVLASAESEPVPIYFFYKSDEAPGWAYQGLVDVDGHRFVTDSATGREVLEFTISHRNSGMTDAGQSKSVSDTSGRRVTETRAGVRVSDTFVEAVYSRCDGRCAVTDITERPLLTVAHVLGRADYPNLAEDHGNAFLLNWTHHAAFDADLWTFDESGRLWVAPDYDPEDEWMRNTLISRHGERLPRLVSAGIGDGHIAQRNDDLDWWPPR